VKFAFIHEQRLLFPLTRLCSVLEVSENGYYNWLKRGKSKRKQEDEQLMERIEDAYHQNRGVYGSPRLQVELQEQGVHCGRKRIVRLMQVLQLSARRKRRNAHKTERDPQHSYAPNLLQRDFTADAPNTKWMSDMTFIETQEGWLYLAGVIDAYSRKIVGWAMGSHHDAELVKHALAMALLQRQPAAGLVHHSDRGSEYTSHTYQDMLQQHNIQVSMSKKGDCYDNAVIESFWGTLKEECIGRNVYQTRNEAKTAVFEYIEVFYNRKRKHSSLGYMSPDRYENEREGNKS
jgi:transposase InsO family protein